MIKPERSQPASEQLAAALRERIVRGDWAPGTRLPPRPALAREMDACLATLQDAVTRVAQEGFLHIGARKQGTFVAQFPPHLTRYRLIFPYGPDDWGQFWHALEAAAQQIATPAQEFLCFYGLSGHRDIVEYQAVVDEVLTRRVSGLIFASSANELSGTPLLEQPGLPRVAIAAADSLPGIPKVYVDLDGLMRQAVTCLADQGCRRIALLCATHGTVMRDKFRAAMQHSGFPVNTCREQFASPRHAIVARHLMELMFQSGNPDRPDGLVIADDNLVTAATEGLVRAGIKVPAELRVIAATNFPNILPSHVPVTRIGFDIPALLDLLVLRLKQLKNGEAPPETTYVPATVMPEADGGC